jgi:hypothetical protein
MTQDNSAAPLSMKGAALSSLSAPHRSPELRTRTTKACGAVRLARNPKADNSSRSFDM